MAPAPALDQQSLFGVILRAFRGKRRTLRVEVHMIPSSLISSQFNGGGGAPCSVPDDARGMGKLLIQSGTPFT